MHELALSQSIVDLVLERAAAERLRTVTRVVVEVGAAAGVDPEALRFCFDAVAEATAVRGAELVIIGVSLRARCRTCRHEFEPAGRLAACPTCGGPGADLLQGRELRVTSFDAE
jgi:hydrogenase nickel incorporation protein HypA/HybF